MGPTLHFQGLRQFKSPLAACIQEAGRTAREAVPIALTWDIHKLEIIRDGLVDCLGDLPASIMVTDLACIQARVPDKRILALLGTVNTVHTIMMLHRHLQSMVDLPGPGRPRQF